MYPFLPVGSGKDCFLRETIASWKNWNMTHDEMEVSFVPGFVGDFTENRPRFLMT